MSNKEARRRGMVPPTASRYGSGRNEFETDVRLPEGYAAGVIKEPIMFGGLGNINWFGNEPEAQMTGGQNLTTRGLYGVGNVDAPVTEEDALEYLGAVNGNQINGIFGDWFTGDLFKGAGGLAILGLGVLAVLKLKGRI
jgi:hypothetical protein